VRLHHGCNPRHVEEIEIQSYFVAGTGPSHASWGLQWLLDPPSQGVKDDRNEQAHRIQRYNLRVSSEVRIDKWRKEA
jgi:hypothetical protein